jgi:hypothetical protein
MEDENQKPTHPFGGVVLRKVKNFCSHFGSELNEMFHHKSKPGSKISQNLQPYRNNRVHNKSE